jgi:hypothetical protein
VYLCRAASQVRPGLPESAMGTVSRKWTRRLLLLSGELRLQPSAADGPILLLGSRGEMLPQPLHAQHTYVAAATNVQGNVPAHCWPT